MQPSIARESGDPAIALSRWIGGAAEGDLLVVEFSLAQWWLPVGSELPLTAVYGKRPGGQYACTVTPAGSVIDGELASRGLRQWSDDRQLPLFSPGQPLLLSPLRIPKPWGQEIWFTGAEERGLCCFSDGQHALPIPWVQSLFPAAPAGSANMPLVLLKILDPAPQEVTGDLYFELHQEKREVYVVTHVDPAAWPDGVGGIRYGFDPQKLAAAGSEDAFRQDYLAAVQAYERVRREIDRLPPEDDLDPRLKAKEQQLREQMNEFTHMRELRVGDVVVVPLLMPHSLQHGVRTIEFQTPVYERQILSFAQEVLTQGHWDTSAAVEHMRLTPPEDDHFAILSSEEGVVMERIVDFPDFEVNRVRLYPGGSVALDCAHSYQLLMVVEGQVPLGEHQLGPEQAALLPRGQAFTLAHSGGEKPLVVLLAAPCI